jgi:hypothetical protein
MLRVIAIVMVSMMTGACAYLNTVSLTPVPKERANQIQVQKHKWIFLGFNFDNDFVDEMNEELKEKCPTGKATGLLTKDESVHYPFFHKRIVSVSGYCVAQQGK